MAARRCSICSRNYPLNVANCPSCGRSTWHSTTSTPDLADPDVHASDEEYELGTVDARVYDVEHDAKIIAWRTHCFMLTGFDELNATTLAVRRDVDREHVERLVSEGCSAGLVLEILL